MITKNKNSFSVPNQSVIDKIPNRELNTKPELNFLFQFGSNQERNTICLGLH